MSIKLIPCPYCAGTGEGYRPGMQGDGWTGSACDMCEGMKEDYIDPAVGKQPQCIAACPHFAIFLTTIEAEVGESRMDAIKREFNIKKRD